MSLYISCGWNELFYGLRFCHLHVSVFFLLSLWGLWSVRYHGRCPKYHVQSTLHYYCSQILSVQIDVIKESMRVRPMKHHILVKILYTWYSIKGIHHTLHQSSLVSVPIITRVQMSMRWLPSTCHVIGRVRIHHLKGYNSQGGETFQNSRSLCSKLDQFVRHAATCETSI